MTRQPQSLTRWLPVLMPPLVLLAASLHSDAQGLRRGQTATVLGQALPSLTTEQQAAFTEGLTAFSGVETPTDGLGPVFNGTGCAECHKAGAIGGASTDLTLSRVTRIGGLKNGKYSDLPEYGGPVLQARSLKEFDTRCPIPGEVIPPQARFVSLRITTPLFGAGLIEAIPAATITAQENRSDPDGIRGVANRVLNPINGKWEIGRFGWKAQVSQLDVFAADAYLNEMGITTPLFSQENPPQGQPIPPGWDSVGDPEDAEDVEHFVNFMRLLAPPARKLPLPTTADQGEHLFSQLRCTACHTPELQTGPSPIQALANKPVRLYSDLLLHRLGSQLADGILQGSAKGDQFRTAPLWGLSRRSLYLHDGRARTLHEAILAHDGEGRPARLRYQNLRPTERTALLTFLDTL